MNMGHETKALLVHLCLLLQAQPTLSKVVVGFLVPHHGWKTKSAGWERERS